MPKSVHMICHCTGEGYRGYRALFEEGGGRFRSGRTQPVVTDEKLRRALTLVAQGLTVREAATRIKVGKTALYAALGKRPR
jgi:hypothetical protein